MITDVLASDIEIASAGHRLAWWPASDRGRAWADAHQVLAEHAPAGIECQAADGGQLLAEALASGLVVRAGDVEVTLC